MHNYHDVNNGLPPGRIWQAGWFGSCGYNFFQCQDTSWFVLMLPQFEQQTLANAFNYSVGVGGPLLPYAGGLLRQQHGHGHQDGGLPVPERPRHDLFHHARLRGRVQRPQASKGNYVASWGNTSGTSPASRASTATTINYMQSAFGQAGNIRFSTVTDGLSNTVFMGEILQGEQYDIRGVIWQSIAGGSHFMSRFTPNSTRDVYGISIRATC